MINWDNERGIELPRIPGQVSTDSSRGLRFTQDYDPKAVIGGETYRIRRDAKHFAGRKIKVEYATENGVWGFVSGLKSRATGERFVPFTELGEQVPE